MRAAKGVGKKSVRSFLDTVFGAGDAPIVADSKTAMQAINAALSTLHPREEEVIRARHFDAEPPLSYAQIGTALGRADGTGISVTRERVRQIEAKALRKLRHPDRARLLRPIIGPPPFVAPEYA